MSKFIVAPKRPFLNRVPIPENIYAPGSMTVTCSPGQWDNLLAAFYRQGALLLEIDIVRGEERAIAAYRKPSDS